MLGPLGPTDLKIVDAMSSTDAARDDFKNHEFKLLQHSLLTSSLIWPSYPLSATIKKSVSPQKCPMQHIFLLKEFKFCFNTLVICTSLLESNLLNSFQVII